MSLPVDAVNWFELFAVVLFLAGCAMEALPAVAGDKKPFFQIVCWFHACFFAGLIGFGWMTDQLFWMWQGVPARDVYFGVPWLSFALFNGILAGYALIVFAMRLMIGGISDEDKKKRGRFGGMGKSGGGV